MIPRPKADGKYKKGKLGSLIFKDNYNKIKCFNFILDWAEKQNKYQFSSKGVKSNTSQSKCQTNFKALQGKETINIKYLTKMKSFCVDVFDKKDDSLTTKDLQTTSKRIRQARKMISDPLVFDKAKFDNDRISEYESGVFQISNVPSKTYINMPSTISILTKISSLEFEDLEVERGKIDKAIRKTKSFTIIKARNVAEEANKLLSDKEFDQRQLKNPMKDDNKIPKKQKIKAEKCTKVKSSSKIITTTDYENSSENGLMYKSEDLTNAIVSFNKSHRNAERRTNPTEPIQVTSEAVTLEESERSFLNANIEVSQDETNSFSEGREIGL